MVATFPALFAGCDLVAAHQVLACWYPAAYAAAWPVEHRPTRRTGPFCPVTTSEPSTTTSPANGGSSLGFIDWFDATYHAAS